MILAIDNGGWSMDPYIPVVQTLFDYARAQFKDVKTFFFHNTVYDALWKDPTRIRKPVRVTEFTRFDPETRLVFVGDASMAPYELMLPTAAFTFRSAAANPASNSLKPSRKPSPTTFG